MVREFSEEKRQEIFRLLDEIDMKDWKSFMEWCGSRKEEFGDWPDKLSVSAYTRYVDQYHEKVLEINEMTRQQVNTVFENVAEIDARYAARMREHREKVKEQIAIVKTMTEFMDSMANGKPNMALLSGGNASGSNGSHVTEKTLEQSMNGVENPEEVANIREDTPGFVDFIMGTAGGVDYESAMDEINNLHNSGFITNKQYKYFQQVINWVTCNRLPRSAIEEIRVQAAKEYTEIINNNHILETYLNDETLMELGWNLSQVDSKLGVNYVEDMRKLMLEYGLTNEESIIFFLYTISIECQNGLFMLEQGNADYFSGQSYTINTRGAGLIHLTGPDQKEFLEYLLANTENEEEKEILNSYITGFVNYEEPDSEHPCDCIVNDPNLPTVAEYIAENYPIESALWYWCVYKKIEIGGKSFTLNECINIYNGKVDEKRMYFAVQCAVNGSEFSARGLGRFFNSNNTVNIEGSEIVLIFADTTDDIDPEENKDNCIGEDEDGHIIYRYTTGYTDSLELRSDKYDEWEKLMIWGE